MRSAIAGLAVILSSTLLSAGQPRFGARVDLHVLSVVARTGDDLAAKGLVASDFEVFEDGKRVAISTFAEVDSNTPTPLDEGRFVVLLLDDLGTHPQFTVRIKDIARDFVRRMGPKDVMSVVLLNGSIGVTTRNPDEVLRAIDQSNGYGKAVLSSGGAGAHAIRTIASLARQLAEVQHRRKVLVCIGSAMTFNSSTHGGYRSEVASALREAARANLTAYVIDPLGLTPKASLSSRAIDRGALAADASVVAKGAGFADYQDGFAFETGGFTFANTNLYQDAIARVWEESGSYYLLGYEPTTRNSRRHVIEVKTNRPGVTARARRTR